MSGPHQRPGERPESAPTGNGAAEALPGAAAPEPGVSAELLAVGQLLREAREKRGWTLDDVETGTHIRRSYLAAIESGRAAALPEEVFVKGFIRTYGDHVDLDGAALVEDYKRAGRLRLAQAAAVLVSRGRAGRRHPRPRAGSPAPAQGDPGSHGRDTPPVRARRLPRPARSRRRGGWGWLVGLLVLCGAFYGVSLVVAHYARRPSAAVPPSTHHPSEPASGSARSSLSGPGSARSSVGASSAVPGGASAHGSSSAAPPSSTAASSGGAPGGTAVTASFTHTAQGWQDAYVVPGAGPIQVTLSASAYCWTDRWVDGSAAGVQYRLAFSAPETVVWTAQQRLEIELGNSEAVTSLVVNGQTMGALPIQAPDPAEYLYFQLG